MAPSVWKSVVVNALLVGFGTGHHLEVHDVALGAVVFDGDHLPTVPGGKHGGHGDVAVAAKSVEPLEFGFDLIGSVVVLAVHAQDATARRHRSPRRWRSPRD